MTRRNENGISMNRAFAKLLSDGGEVERLRAELDALKAELAKADAAFNDQTDELEKAVKVLEEIHPDCAMEYRYRAYPRLHIRPDGFVLPTFDAYIARVKRLRAGLIRLRDCDWVITLPDRMDAVRDIARETLEEDENANHP